jgi:hypothetical protein
MLKYVASVVGALIVLALGKYIASRRPAASSHGA